MLKYLAMLIVVLGFAFVIARHDQYATLNSSHKSADQNNAAPAIEANENHPQENPKDSRWDSPTGHIFHDAFRWPEGTTVWAIILTLLAVAEQAVETKRAATATLAQARIASQTLVAEFRPIIRIRTIKLPITDDPLSVAVHIVNIGGTPAHLAKANIELTWLYTSKWDNDTKIWSSETSFQPLRLAAGERIILPIPCEDSRVVIACAKLPVDRGEVQSQFLVCRGEIEYVDDNGVNRVTAFRRIHHFSSERFVADSDPEYEYED